MAVGDSTRQEVGRSDILSDEPISKVLYPGGVDPDSSTSPWNDYDIWYSDNLLQIEAKKSIINSVTWLSEMIIELTFQDSPTRYFVTPLQPVEESERDDEVKVDYVVLLVGRYLIIAEVAADYVAAGGGNGTGNDDELLGPRYIMTNYLRITNVEERSSTRRGSNRLKKPDSKTRCTFR